MLNNAFRCEIFPIKDVYIDDYYIYDDEFDPSTTPTTPPAALDLSPLPRGSSQVKGIKILPLKQLLQRLIILLSQLQAGYPSQIFWIRLDKLSNHYIEQGKSQKRYAIRNITIY